MQTTKDAAHAEKARAQQAVTEEREKPKNMAENNKSKANAKAVEQQRAKNLANQKKAKAKRMAAEQK